MARSWVIALSASATGVALWWLHILLTDAFPPFENAFDTALWITCSALKIASLVFVPWALGRVFVKCHRDLRSTAKATAVWGLVAVLLLGSLSALREPLARHLDNDAARYYPTSVESPQMNLGYAGVGVEEQLAHWRSGRTFALELGLILGSVLVLGAFGFAVGRFGMGSGLAAAVVVAVPLFFASLRLGLLVWDYDLFFAGTVLGPAPIDAVLAPYVAVDPTTAVGFLVYAGIIWSSWVIDRFVLAKLPSAERVPEYRPLRHAHSA